MNFCFLVHFLEISLPNSVSQYDDVVALLVQYFAIYIFNSRCSGSWVIISYIFTHFIFNEAILVTFCKTSAF